MSSYRLHPRREGLSLSKFSASSWAAISLAQDVWEMSVFAHVSVGGLLQEMGVYVAERRERGFAGRLFAVREPVSGGRGVQVSLGVLRASDSADTRDTALRKTRLAPAVERGRVWQVCVSGRRTPGPRGWGGGG